MPVGRLDKDSSGLLLFVREGPLVARLQKPGTLEKVYETTVRGPVEDHHLVALHKGVGTDLGVLRADQARILGTEGKLSRVRLILREGRNRQIRRLFNALRDDRLGKPLKVMALRRVRFGPQALDLGEGDWRFLSESEEGELLAAANIIPEGNGSSWIMAIHKRF